LTRRIYVAGGSTERLSVVRPWMDMLRNVGWTITHDWTESEGYDRQFTHEEQQHNAKLDLDGVLAADWVWLLVPATKSEGLSVELGAALARGKPTVASGAHVGRSIFHTLVPCFLRHAEAYSHLLEHS
jgi:hypothetical protein